MKLSIITINYNNAAGLKKTLDSVAVQTSTDFEHIIVDGASTDGSVDEIIAYSQSPIANRHKITWISEPDTGIYNAMNKGIKMANGEYLLMLNSGDYLINEHVIGEVFPYLDGTDIVQGNLILNVQGKYMLHKGYAHSDLSFIEIQHGDFPHQAMFIKKSLHDVYGYYDESYRFIADTLFFLKSLGFGNATYKYINKTVAFFEPGGVTDRYVEDRAKESQRMIEENISNRLYWLCTVDDNKIALYEKLHTYRLIWYMTLVLVKISETLGAKKRFFDADKYTEYKGEIR